MAQVALQERRTGGPVHVVVAVDNDPTARTHRLIDHCERLREVAQLTGVEETREIRGQIVGQRIVDQAAAHQDLGDQGVTEPVGSSDRACGKLRGGLWDLPDRCRRPRLQKFAHPLTSHAPDRSLLSTPVSPI